jgi:hypothetical protein
MISVMLNLMEKPSWLFFIAHFIIIIIVIYFYFCFKPSLLFFENIVLSSSSSSFYVLMCIFTNQAVKWEFVKDNKVLCTTHSFIYNIFLLFYVVIFVLFIYEQ